MSLKQFLYLRNIKVTAPPPAFSAGSYSSFLLDYLNPAKKRKTGSSEVALPNCLKHAHNLIAASQTENVKCIYIVSVVFFFAS